MSQARYSYDTQLVIIKCSVLICPTINRGSFGQDGDSALSHILLVLNGGAFGPPAVGANKQEVACQVGAFGGLQHPSERGQILLTTVVL